MGRLIYILPIFLFLSCSSTKAPIAERIEGELVAIEVKAPEVQEHVDNIRDEIPKIRKIEDDKSTLETWLPWVIVVGSLVYGVWGFRTDELEDTIGCVVGVGAGIAVATFWDKLAWIGLGGLVLFIIGWSVVTYDMKKHKNKE